MRPVCGLALLAVIGTLSVARCVAADGDVSLAPGARIRVSSPSLGDELVVGGFIGLLAETLAFKPAKSRVPMRVLLDERTTIEMSTAHHNRAGRYAAIGAALGALIGGVIGDRAQNDTDRAIAGESTTASEVGTGPLLIGLTLGAVVGGIVGANHQVDTWVPVRLSKPAP